MKNKFILYSIIALLSVAAGVFGYYNYLKKEVSWNELIVLTEVSSKRDYCYNLGMIKSKDSELFDNVISKVYTIDSEGNNKAISKDKYKKLVERGLEVYNTSPDKDNPVVKVMLKDFCQELEEQAKNLKQKYN